MSTTTPSAFDRAGHPDARRLDAGLTEAECAAVARAARRLPGAWWVQRDEDELGRVGLGLVPDDAGPDDAGFTFLLRREGGRLRLACAQGEFYADLGAHAGVGATMAAVRRALDAAAAVERWFEGGTGAGRPAPGVGRRAAAGRRPLRDPAAAAVRLADWADEARYSGRALRADRLMLLAWEAHDRPRRAAA